MYKRLLLFLIMVLSIQCSFAQNYVEIGTGTATTYQPSHGGWKYSWMSTMYTSEELGGAKTMTQVAFYRGFEDIVQWGADWDVTNQKVYMKLTEETKFTPAPEGGFYYPTPTNPVSGYTQVFEGSYNYGAFGWHVITLDTPFEYDGTSSLVLHWESRSGESTWNLKWTGTTAVDQPTRSIYGGSDEQFSTENGEMYLDNARTNIRFYYDSGDAPATPSDPSPMMNSIKNVLETEVSFTLGDKTTNYDLYFGTDESAMTKVVDNAVGTEGVHSYAPAGLLQAKTDYYWQVVAKNATDSEASPVWNFETEGAITDFPWSESFEEKWQGISQWWSSIINTNYPNQSDWSWDKQSWDFSIAPNVQDDSTAIYCSPWADGEYHVKTPRIILPASQRISFWWRNNLAETKVAGKDSTFFEITTDGGDSWTILDTLSPAVAMTEWENPIIDLSAYSGNNVYLRWRYKINDGVNNVYIDNIDIYDVPTGAVIELSEKEIVYKDVAINGQTKIPVIVKNTGVEDLVFTSIPVASPFSCDYTGTIKAEHQDTVYIYFSPETAGTFKETITFNSNATGANTIALTGTGINLEHNFYETFDAAQAMPEGWGHIDSPLGYTSGGGVVITSGVYDVYSEPYAAKLLISNDTVSPIILLSPGVDNFATNTLRFKAVKWDSSRDLDLQVGVLADPYDASSFVAAKTFQLTDEYTEYTISFKPSNTAPYIAFKNGGNPTGSSDWLSMRIDDISWEANTEDVPLAAVLASPENSIENMDIMNNPILRWTAGSSNTNGFYVYLGTSSTAFDVIAGDNVDANPANYEVTQKLEYNTRYYWKIVPYNEFGSCADNVVWSFKTMQDPTVTELPWFENFDNTSAIQGSDDHPLGWSIDNVQGDLTWDLLVDNPNFGPTSHSAPNAMHVAFGMNAKDDYLYTPPIRLEGGAYYELSFWIHTDMDMITGQVYTEKLKVYAGLDNSVSAMTTLIADTLVDDVDYLQVKVEFNPEIDGDYYFGFYACSDPMMYLLILDDVKLELVNSAPAFESTPVTDAKVGVSYNYAVEASDPNGDDVTITAKTKPSWLSFSDNGDGTATLLGIPSTIGDYDVVLNVSDGVFNEEQKFTITVTEGATGINDINESAHIVLAPNPAKSYVNIMVQESFTVPYQVQVVNIIGEVVFESFVDENQYKLNLEGFDSGLYFVIVFDGYEKYNQKLIIR